MLLLQSECNGKQGRHKKTREIKVEGGLTAGDVGRKGKIKETNLSFYH